MADLDKPVVSLIKDINPEKIADGADEITLHQAMSMSSGIRVSEDRQNIIQDGGSKIRGFSVAKEYLQHSDTIPPEPGIFKYQDSDPRITMLVLDSVVPGSAQEFIKTEVLAKVGITVYRWRTDINGMPKAENNSSITSRDMLKLGALVLNNGKWKGEQILSEEYLATITKRTSKPTETWIPDTYLYSYFRYKTDVQVGDNSYELKFAWGGGGQYIITIEELDLVVVITGHDREDKIMAQISPIILAAFVDGKYSKETPVAPDD